MSSHQHPNLISKARIRDAAKEQFLQAARDYRAAMKAASPRVKELAANLLTKGFDFAEKEADRFAGRPPSLPIEPTDLTGDRA